MHIREKLSNSLYDPGLGKNKNLPHLLTQYMRPFLHLHRLFYLTRRMHIRFRFYF